jgi:transposase
VSTSGGPSWPLPTPLEDARLEARRWPGASALPLHERPLPDVASGHRPLRDKGVPLALLRYRSIGQESQATPPEGLQYSPFCEPYRRCVSTLDLVMRQQHRAGEKCFLDSAGPTVPVVDSPTGEGREAPVVVAPLGASNYPSAEASWTPALAEGIASPRRALASFGAARPRAP